MLYRSVDAIAIALCSLCFRLGLDVTVLADIVNSSSGRCWSSELYNPVPGILPNVPSSKNYEVLSISPVVIRFHLRPFTRVYSGERNQWRINAIIAHR